MRQVLRLFAFGGAVSLALMSAATGASGVSRERPSWNLAAGVLASSGPGPDDFTAVTALTATSAWAFETTASKAAPIVAWRLTGSTWSRASFPERYGSEITAATRASATTAYVATSGGALLMWTGATWALVGRFDSIVDVGATGAGDVWVTGRRFRSPASGGLWQLDHGSWRHRSPRYYGHTIDAVSDSAIFSVTNEAIEEFNGTSWRITSLSALLPPKQALCPEPGLTSVDALSATDVWVTAAGNCQDFSGPFRLLHLVHSTWTIAADRNEARGYAFSAGGGSLWIPTKAFACVGCTVMLHLAAGRLTQVSLPLGKQGVTIEDGSTAPGSTASIAVGWTLKGTNFSEMQGVILRYGN